MLTLPLLVSLLVLLFVALLLSFYIISTSRAPLNMDVTCRMAIGHPMAIIYNIAAGIERPAGPIPMSDRYVAQPSQTYTYLFRGVVKLGKSFYLTNKKNKTNESNYNVLPFDDLCRGFHTMPFECHSTTRITIS